MTAEAAQREPTMEEILASIRRIISEDDTAPDEFELKPEPAPAGPAPAAFEDDEIDFAAPEPAPTPAPPPPRAIAPEPAPQLSPPDDLMIMEAEFDEPAAPEPEPAPPRSEISYEPTFESRPRPVTIDDDSLVGAPAAEQAAGALGKLMGSMMISSGVTLDGVVRELLKPMLKDWLNANLPRLVEAEVQKEIERIRRMAQ